MEIEHARVESTTNDRETAHQIDAQIVKTHYARTNNDKILNFVIQEDPNLCLDFSSITISLSVDVPKTHFPDNGFCAKLFQSMNVEINSQLITSSKSM